MRLLNAFHYSCQGLLAAWNNEASFRLEVLLSLIIIPCVFYFGKTRVERALLWFSWVLVLLTELINSSIEAVVNRIGPEMHTLSGMAKDMGSAAVLVALINASIIWVFLVFKRQKTRL